MTNYKDIFRVALLVMVSAVNLYAQEHILIRLSYKVILNPATGTRPPGVTDNDIDAAIAAMDTLLDDYSRGYRFERLGGVIDIGGLGNTTGPSRWYNTDFFADNGDDLKDEMEQLAMTNPGLYAWNPNTINIYVTNFNGQCGGKCSFPDDNDNILVIAACSDRNAITQLHEIGHYFSLFHTQGKTCGCCDSDLSGECHTEPGDDEIDDTLPDLACWNRDNIADWTFGQLDSSLSAMQREQVDNTFLNVMSYHGSSCGQNATTDRMTELQLDRWADSAKFHRMDVVDGQTWFVDPSLGGGFGGGGYSLFPFASLSMANAVANSNDIVLIRPGTLIEEITIRKPMTLRATRRGPAIIQAP